jgi:hypothetical protein
MGLVQTTKGLIERSRLRVVDVVSEDENSRAIGTEYYLGDELVRRSAWVDMYRGLAAELGQGHAGQGVNGSG